MSEWIGSLMSGWRGALLTRIISLIGVEYDGIKDAVAQYERESIPSEESPNERAKKLLDIVLENNHSHLPSSVVLLVTVYLDVRTRSLVK